MHYRPYRGGELRVGRRTGQASGTVGPLPWIMVHYVVLVAAPPLKNTLERCMDLKTTIGRGDQPL